MACHGNHPTESRCVRRCVNSSELTPRVVVPATSSRANLAPPAAAAGAAAFGGGADGGGSGGAAPAAFAAAGAAVDGSGPNILPK